MMLELKYILSTIISDKNNMETKGLLSGQTAKIKISKLCGLKCKSLKCALLASVTLISVVMMTIMIGIASDNLPGTERLVHDGVREAFYLLGVLIAVVPISAIVFLKEYFQEAYKEKILQDDYLEV